MNRACTICGHEKRAEVDAALLRNEPMPDIARRYGTSIVSVLTHRGHLAENVGAPARPQAAKPEPLVDRIRGVQEKCLVLLDIAEGASEVRTVFSSLREMRQHLQALGAMAYELGSPKA